MYELKPGQASLFKNDKEGNDKRPDYAGKINIGGKIMRLSGWMKKGPKGSWMSLNVSEFQDKGEKWAGDDDTKSRRGPKDDGDIPW